MSKKAKPSPRKKSPDINKVRAEIRQLAQKYDYDKQVLLKFAEFVNGGAFKPV